MALFGNKDKDKKNDAPLGFKGDITSNGETTKVKLKPTEKKQLKSENLLSPEALCEFVNKNSITPAWIVGTDHLHIVYYYA